MGEGHRDREMVLVGPVRLVRGERIGARWIQGSDGLGVIGLRRVMATLRLCLLIWITNRTLTLR